MIKCTNCNSYYDENVNSSCPYCEVETTGGNGFFSNSSNEHSGEKTEVYKGNTEETQDVNEQISKTEVYNSNNNMGKLNTKLEEKNDNTNQSDKTVFVRSGSKNQTQKSNDTQGLLVGWFVIIDGPGKGSDLRIEMGQNSIGRNSTNMISIDFGDSTISREKHAFIIYDPKHKQFMFKSGEGQNISYLNETGVYSPMPIKNGDIVEIGETKLRFVQFIDDSFDWE